MNIYGRGGKASENPSACTAPVAPRWTRARARRPLRYDEGRFGTT